MHTVFEDMRRQGNNRVHRVCRLPTQCLATLQGHTSGVQSLAALGADRLVTILNPVFLEEVTAASPSVLRHRVRNRGERRERNGNARVVPGTGAPAWCNG